MRHTHEPSVYHDTFAAHPPVGRIAPGDTVVTRCLDADGCDHEGRRLTDAENPLTGPFHVAGAEPGDVLSVHFDRITPSRRRAWSTSRIAPGLVDSPDVADGRAAWDVDAGTATLVGSPLTLPLAPMLGSFGVAPADGSSSSATAGRHGGNMDYRGFRAGVTVELPVFVAGALLFLGDGHALQGEGEIAGSGVEVSMEVEFTVGVRKGGAIGWPRGVTSEHLFAVGNARPLELALGYATSEMLAWLTGEHRLAPRTAHLLLAHGAEYDVGNVFDPAFTMACKVRREVLEQVSGR